MVSPPNSTERCYLGVPGLAAVKAGRESVNASAAKTLGPCSDIDDAVIGFYAQQMVEKSLKVALALGDVGFRMMEHDLDFLLTLAAKGDIEIPSELTRATWLTAWGTTYENGEAPPGNLDRQETIEIGAAAVSWCANLVGQGDPNASRDSPPPAPSSVPGLGRPETKGRH